MDLDTLLAPLDADAFLNEYWPMRQYFSPDGTGRLAALDEIEELQEVESVISTSKRVNFFSPTGEIVKAEHPLKLYQLGLTCYMSCNHVPGLMQIAENIAAGLGLASGSLTCEAFCSSGDSGVTMHSDRDLNFALLVRGHKRWRIAENHHIRNQTSLCRPSSQPTYDQRQLELADELPFPERMPDDATVVDVDPGGLLFLPRGWWHETKAVGECLQVNFVMNQPLWVDVLTKGLREHLLDDVAWRAMAFDVFRADDNGEGALALFADLIRGLSKTLDEADPADLAATLLTKAGLRAAHGPLAGGSRDPNGTAGG